MASSLSPFKPKIKLILWGDSHFCNNHFFPYEFESFLTGPLSRYQTEFINNSVGGKRFNDNFVAQFEHFLEGNQDASSYYVHIIFLGGNNIRDAFRFPATVEARIFRVNQMIDELVQGHTGLLTKVAQKERTLAVLISPLPSQHSAHEPYFEKLASRLKVVAKQNKVPFVDVRDSLATVEGVSETGLANRVYIKKFFQDDVHLNREGAKILAKRVFSVLNSIPNATFGYRKLPANRRPF